MMVEIPARRRAGDPPEQSSEAVEGEGTERSLPQPRRQDGPFIRKQEPVASPESVLGHASSVMQRVAVTSVAEIESLIGELEQLRDFLRRDSIRIQREIEGYARLSEEATKSTKIIAESVAQWQDALTDISGRRA
jgi:hypothetical protein